MPKKNLYYTKDHDWIEFRETIAYTGVCGFKLIGFKAIQHMTFAGQLGFKKRGELLATIKYKDYVAKVRMPVDGNVIEINSCLSYDSNHLLLKHADIVWIAKITPAKPDNRKDLLRPREYHTTGKIQ